MQKFVIDGRPPSLNEFIYAGKIQKGTWNKASQMKKDYQQVVRSFIRKANLKPVDYKVDIHYQFYEPNKRRDKDNISGFARKVINDSLQKENIIINDNWTHVGKLSEDVCIDKEYPRIEVFLKRSK